MVAFVNTRLFGGRIAAKWNTQVAHNQTTKVYSSIKEKILNGQFKPSQPLPEMEMAKMFEVGRSTVKKAFLMLQSENLIELRDNHGARVRSFDIEEITQYLKVRTLLEGYVAEITAPVIPDEMVAKMEEILQVMQSLFEVGNFLEYSAHNEKFHGCIYASCPNRVASDMILGIRMQIGRYNFKTIMVPGRGNASIREHWELLGAYKNHDGAKAKEITLAHVSNLLDTLHKNYNYLFI